MSSTTTTTTTYTGKRITFHTSTPFETVLTTLRRLTNRHSHPSSTPLPKPPKPFPSMTKTEFISHWTSLTGPSGFAYFTEFDYGDWIGLFDVGDGVKMKRFIVGNPLIAVTMLEWDLNASLFVPVEIMIREVRGGNGGDADGGTGTEVRYNLPSSQILVGDVAESDQELRRAVEYLDGKLEGLVRDICG